MTGARFGRCHARTHLWLVWCRWWRCRCRCPWWGGCVTHSADSGSSQHQPTPCRHRLIPIISVRLQSSQRLPLPQLPHSRPSIKVIHKSLMKVLLYSARAALLPHHGAKLVSVSSLGPQATGGRWSQFSPSEGVRGVSCAGLQSADAGVPHFSSCCCVVAAMVEVCELLSG